MLSHQCDIADLIGHSIAILRKDYYASCRKGLSVEYILITTILLLVSVADPGFLGVEGHQLPRAVHQPIISQNFCRKMHGNERTWTERGTRVPGAPTPWIRHWVSLHVYN